MIQDLFLQWYLLACEFDASKDYTVKIERDAAFRAFLAAMEK